MKNISCLASWLLVIGVPSESLTSVGFWLVKSGDLIWSTALSDKKLSVALLSTKIFNRVPLQSPVRTRSSLSPGPSIFQYYPGVKNFDPPQAVPLMSTSGVSPSLDSGIGLAALLSAGPAILDSASSS